MPLDAVPPKLKATRVPAGEPHPLLRQVEAALACWVSSGAPLCVGLSGGIDSVVLLDLLLLLAPRHQWRISAIHVNHQLQADAPAWARFCRQLCVARGVPLRVTKVQVRRCNSIEAAARAARYAAYRSQPAENVVLAQHQDDQAETLLLQLLRGAGVKGLAAMPPARADKVRPGLTLLRPLLDVTRGEIEQYAAQRGLRWVDDHSNRDPYYLRNYLRQEIMPRLEARVPAYRTTLSRAAAQMAEAAQLLDDLALQDGADALRDDTLAASGLAALPEARARNLLRYFLRERDVRMPDARRLDEALRQALSAKADARLCVSLGTHELRRYRGLLYAVPVTSLPCVGFRRPWHDEHRLALPELQGVLEMQRRRSGGIDLARLLAAPVTVRTRSGGEKLRPDALRPRRPVKDLLQMQGVPSWRRERLPFLWSGERLVWVAGVGIDCAFRVQPGGAGVMPRWIEDGRTAAAAARRQS